MSRTWLTCYIVVTSALWFAVGAFVGASLRDMAAHTTGSGLSLGAMLGGGQ
jgi:hypothetical protein